jgi:hypothetical protein
MEQKSLQNVDFLGKAGKISNQKLKCKRLDLKK